MQWHSGKLQAQQCEKINQQGVAEREQEPVGTPLHLGAKGPCFYDWPPPPVPFKYCCKAREMTEPTKYL